MENELKSLLILFKEKLSDRPDLKVLCYDSTHNRVFDILDFLQELDPSDFSPGSFDVRFSIETSGTYPRIYGGFRVMELSPGPVCWVSNFRTGHTRHMIDIMVLILKYFKFDYILLPAELTSDKDQEFINAGFMRLINAKKETTILYLNISDEDRS